MVAITDAHLDFINHRFLTGNAQAFTESIMDELELAVCEFPVGDSHVDRKDALKQTELIWHKFASTTACRRPWLCRVCFDETGGENTDREEEEDDLQDTFFSNGYDQSSCRLCR